MLKADWSIDKIESWVGSTHAVYDEEREFLAQFSTLMPEKRIDQILLSLMHSDHFSKNESGYQMKFLRTKETKIIFNYYTDNEVDDIENGPRIRGTNDKLDDSYDSDVDVKKELRYIAVDQDADHALFEMEKRTEPFYILFQFKLVKIMSTCIIWIPDIHDLHMNKSNYLYRCLLVKYISMNYETSSTNLKIFQTNGFRSITLNSNVQDLIALTNEALPISIRFDRIPIADHGILFYQIGRALAQNVLLSHCLIDPASIYMKKESCDAVDSYLYKWYFELGTRMKKLTILLCLLSCSAGSVAQDLWSPPDPMKKWDRFLWSLHGLLEVEDALVGLSRTEKENDPVPVLILPKLRNPLDMMKNGSCSILDRRSLYGKSESGLDEGFKSEVYEFRSELNEFRSRLVESKEDLESKQSAQDLVHHIVWAPRIWIPLCFLFDSTVRTTELGFPYWPMSLRDKWTICDEDEFEESEFLQSGIVEELLGMLPRYRYPGVDIQDYNKSICNL
ncbi:hypothetical protein Cgig2_006737 [Carnegiea gigantea]|uniref:Uncharacterized protein n=1 Tax=Carnegiea gigantea TaxID=171969 RepID=A0A9Q1GUW0_9CARY|nr:hypothetical protein Cgig2_006737 [Carnegiea gigantea]